MANIKSMTLEQAKAYKQQLKDQGKTLSTSKEMGKVENYIKTLQPEKYGEETVTSAYKQLASGVTTTGGWTEKNLSELNARGIYPKLTSPTATGAAGGGDGDLSGYLNGYQDSVYGAAGSPELRESIAQQLEPDIAKPEPINRVEEYEKMREQMGVADNETLLNDLKAQLEEQYASKRARTQAAEGKPVALGVIAGRVSEIERQETERIDAIGRQINVITDQLNTAYNTISTYINFMGLDYQDAVKAYEDDYNKNLQIYKLADEEMDEQEQRARANLQTYANAITSGNMSYGQLSPDQKLMINKLEIQAGLPVGFTGSLKLSAKDKILGTSSDGTQAWVIGDDGNMTVINTGLTAKPTAETQTAKTQKLAQDMGTMLRARTGSDGKVSPSDWQKGLNGWTDQGGNIQDYKDRFGGYVNKSYDGWYNDYAGFSIKDSNEYYEG